MAPKPRRKPEDTRQGHRSPARTSTALAIPNSDHFQAVPNSPRNLLDVTRHMWDDFWVSDLAPFVRRTDLPALRRLFTMYDELERTRAALYKEPPARPTQAPSESHNDWQMRMRQWRIETQAQGRLTPSPKGGVSLNPLLSHMARLESQIVALEDRFGLSVRSRMDLGLTVLKAESLADQNAAQLEEFRKAQEANGSSPEGFDPRAALLVASENSRRKAAS